MIEVTAAIIKQGSQILICQRPKGKSCEFLWEFPGGKIEEGETGEQCIIRECQEELGITLRVLRELTDLRYDYPNRAVHLHFYVTEILTGAPTLKEHNDLAWIAPDEVALYQFCPADAIMLKGPDWAREMLVLSSE